MEVTAQLNNLRVAPRKVRLVSGLLKGLDVGAARSRLDYTVKLSAKPLAKLLDSAVANAHNNFGLVKDNLFVKQVIVNEGTKLKRFRPKGFGSTSPIEKKTSHIKIILEERTPGLRATPAAKAEKEKVKTLGEEKPVAVVEQKAVLPEKKSYAKTKEIKPDQKQTNVFKGIRKMFRRKSI